MISSLTGHIDAIGTDHTVINVNGFGMLVYAPSRVLSHMRVGEQATILTTLIVREDSMTLYGFTEQSEREVFDLLLSVSGVGPRIALAALSIHTAQEIERAVATGDDKAFTKVPGIGPKGARRIVLELAGKLILSNHDDASDQLPFNQGVSWKPQVIDALMGLGWNEKDATVHVDTFIEHQPGAETMTVAQALKAILATLGNAHTNRR